MKTGAWIMCLVVVPIVACGSSATLSGNLNVTAPADIDSSPANNSPISAEQLSEVIEPRQLEIQGCYEIGLSGHRDLSGKLVIRFRIQPGGAVSDVWITRNDLTPEVGECVSKLFTSLVFPHPESAKSVLVEYPLNLVPAN